MSIDDMLLLVKKVIYNAVKSGDAKSGDYFLLDDDGVYIRCKYTTYFDNMKHISNKYLNNIYSYV